MPAPVSGPDTDLYGLLEPVILFLTERAFSIIEAFIPPPIDQFFKYVPREPQSVQGRVANKCLGLRSTWPTA